MQKIFNLLSVVHIKYLSRRHSEEEIAGRRVLLLVKVLENTEKKSTPDLTILEVPESSTLSSAKKL